MSKRKITRNMVTAEEKDLIRRLYPDHDTAEISDRIGRSTNRIYQIAASIGIRKSPEYLAKLAEKNAVRLPASGLQNRFQKGQKSWNAGIPFSPGGRAVETQFGPGNRPHTWKPIGTERISKEGYLQRKISDTGYTSRDYVPVHHLVWKESGREIPPGYVLIFRDGNRMNLALDNLELISKVEHMQRNSVHRHGPEIAQIAQLRGVLTRHIQQRSEKTDEQK